VLVMDISQFQISSRCDMALSNIRKMELESATADSSLELDKDEIFHTVT
jgi:hypothetical protein